MSTKIEWTDETWNPIVGCSKISEGCENCYAEKMANRLASMGCSEYGFGVVNPFGEWSGKAVFIESALEKPLHWKRPRKIFVCSMGDLFHESVPFEWIDKVMAVIALCPQHTFQILTKRPKRMAEYFADKNIKTKIFYASDFLSETCDYSEYSRNLIKTLKESWPLPNLWLGVTAENQHRADERIPILLRIPAAKQFVSLEPMLGEIDIESYLSGKPSLVQAINLEPQDNLYFPKLDWVIVGGETGHGARPMHPKWVKSILNQCNSAGVAFFFKSWGEWAAHNKPPIRGTYNGGGIFLKPDGVCGCQGDWWDGHAAAMNKVGKKNSGYLIDGREYREFPIPF